jgi:F0F1-type ATP synthase membrane subunit b/b'
MLSAEAKAKAAAAVELAKETAPMLRDLRLPQAEKRAARILP